MKVTLRTKSDKPKRSPNVYRLAKFVCNYPKYLRRLSSILIQFDTRERFFSEDATDNFYVVYLQEYGVEWDNDVDPVFIRYLTALYSTQEEGKDISDLRGEVVETLVEMLVFKKYPQDDNHQRGVNCLVTIDSEPFNKRTIDVAIWAKHRERGEFHEVKVSFERFLQREGAKDKLNFLRGLCFKLNRSSWVCLVSLESQRALDVITQAWSELQVIGRERFFDVLGQRRCYDEGAALLGRGSLSPNHLLA